MEVKKYKVLFQNELSSFFDAMEIDQFFYLTLEKIHQLKRVDLALNPNFEMTVEEEQYWDSVLTQLKTQKPIQYILGETVFYDLIFKVNTFTLIPRPETEELVRWILEDLTNIETNKLKILDIGTGSGCIPISIKKNVEKATVYALDVSKEALALAKENAIINQTSIHFIHQDILTTTTLDEQFDIIVSNPPYVRNLEKVAMSTNVLQYEPHLALFVSDENPLLFYRKIAELAQKDLKGGGILYFEINQYLAKEVIDLLASLAFQAIELKKDIYGNDRMIKAVKGF